MRLMYILLVLTLFSCEEKEVVRRFELPDGSVLSQFELNQKKAELLKGVKAQYQNASIIEELVQERTHGDTIIRSIQLRINTGTTAVELETTDPLLKFGIGDLLRNDQLVYLDGAAPDPSLPTMYNFWFTSCPPCIEELPGLNQLAQRYAGRVNFVAVTFNDEAMVNAFRAKRNFNYIHAVDAEDFIDALGITTFPRNIFTTSNGQVTAIAYGLPAILKTDGTPDLDAQIKTFSTYIESTL